MFSIIKLRTYILVILTLQSFFVLLVPVHGASYVFSYIALDDSGIAEVVSINPVTKASSTAQMQLFPIDTRVHVEYPSWVSPSGEWMTLQYYTSQTSGAIRLINLRSGEIRDIAPGGVNLEMGKETQPDQVEAWSPNARYLAFSIFSPNDPATNMRAYLYDVISKTLVKLNVHQTESLRFAWSSDSSQLAVEGQSNDFTTNYSTSIDILDVKTNTLNLSIPNLGQIDITALCNLKWSPDGRYIAFISGCDPSDLFIDHEVFVWDTQIKKSIQVTTLAASILTNSLAIESTYYLYWLKTNQLLVGQSIRSTHVGNSSVTTLTIIYDTSKAISTFYNTGKVQALSVNSITGKLVMSIIPAYDSDFNPVSSQIKLGNLDENVSISGVTLVDGNQFSWSPDGQFLVYQETGTNKFAFVDVSTNKPSISYTFDDSTIKTSLPTPENGNPQQITILPIGWSISN